MMDKHRSFDSYERKTLLIGPGQHTAAQLMSSYKTDMYI
jgi:hypothetical protein